ncbi:T9SS type A sorting domain-containing protein [Marivirga tractuosa]|uniref:T9SS type A sorting domain-containing protein n=1 Tax=Marivirga tractuosa TaxID=1006 RepID=UPI0035D0B02D
MSSSLYNSAKIINIYVHVLKKTDGTGGLTNTQVSDWIDLLCQDFSVHNIAIRLIGQSDIRNTSYYNGITFDSYSQLINTNTHSNAIDIYMLSPNDTYSRASAIPGIALAIGGYYVGTSVFSHEFGHCLGLFHTHSGRGCNDPLNCSENINGSNCSTCGDLVCDTPADPCLSGKVDANCIYTGDSSFSPDVNNIMSYSRVSCLNRITIGQSERFHSIISTHSLFTNRTAFITLSGTSTVCPFNSSFNLNNLPTGATVFWETSNNINISTSNNNSVTVQSSSSTVRGDGWIRATINNGCGNIEVEKEVWVERLPANPSLMQGSSNVVPNAWEYYSVSSQAEANSYTWNIPSGWSFHHTSSTTSNQVLLVTGSSSGSVAVRANNECGVSNYRPKYVTVTGDDCGSPVCYFTYSPNPVEETLTVEMEPTSFDISSNDKYQISLNNQYGKVVYEAESNSICHDIDMKKMPKGMYRIVVSHRGKQQIAKILKQ